MYAAQPAKAEISNTPSPSNAVAKAGFAKLWDSITGLWGTTGKPHDALAASRLIDPQAIYNMRLVFSLPGGNVLRATLKGNDNNDFSADNPGMIAFRGAIGDGNVNLRNLVANLTLDYTSGATLGHVDAVYAPLYHYLIEKDANTWKLAVSGTFLGSNGRFSTTLMSNAADLATVLYADEALADKPGRLIAITLDKQAVAGTWATLPSEHNVAEFTRYLRGPLPRGHLSGLALSNNAGDAVNDIDIAPGVCRDSRDFVDLALHAAMTKQLDAAWAVGSGAGMRATGVAIANATYHIFVIYRPDTGVTDIAADTDINGGNIPANTNAAYTVRRRIGSILREAAAIVAFSQYGDEFLRSAPVLDVSATDPGVAAVSRTLSVPDGLKVNALITLTGTVSASTDFVALITPLDVADAAPSHTAAPLNHSRGNNGSGNAGPQVMDVRTNASRQVRSRLLNSDGSTTLRIATRGWIDRRGRDD